MSRTGAASSGGRPQEATLQEPEPPLLHIVSMNGQRPYPPVRSAFTADFWAALAQGRLLTTWCAKCHRPSFPPKPFCPHCWHRGVRWRALQPRGTVYSATTVHASPQLFRDEVPYQVCIVDLIEGVRVATRLIGDTTSAEAIGKPGELVVLAYADGPLFAARVVSSVEPDR